MITMQKIKTKLVLLALLFSYGTQAGKYGPVVYEAQRQLDKAKKEFEERQRIIDLFTALDRDYDGLEREHNKLQQRNKLDAMKASLISARQANELTAMGQRVRDGETALTNARRNLEEKTAQCDALNTRFNTLQAQHDATQRAHADLTAERRDNLNTIAANNRTIAELRSEMDGLRAAQERSNRQAATRETFFTRTLNRIGAALGFGNGTNPEQIIAKIRANQVRMNALEQNNARLNRQNARITRQNLEQAGRIRQLEGDLRVAQQEIRGNQDEIRRLNANLNTEVRAKNQLQTQYDALVRKHDEAALQHASDLSKLEAKRAAERADLEGRIDGLKKNLIDLTNANTQKDARINLLEKDLADQAGVISQSNATIKELRGILGQRDDNIKALNDQLEVSNNLANLLRNNLDTEQKQNAQLGKQVTELNTQVQVKDHRIEALNNEVKDLRGNLKEQRENNAELQNNFERMKKFFQQQEEARIVFAQQQKAAQEEFFSRLGLAKDSSNDPSKRSPSTAPRKNSESD